MIDRTCLTCGRSFQVYPYKIKEGKGNYCSKDCIRWPPGRSKGPVRQPADRFWEKVDTHSSPDGCWLWTGGLSAGYGSFVVESSRAKGFRTMHAHRWSYERAFGPVPEGKFVLHKRECPNRNCVNPAHLYAGNPKENAIDAAMTKSFKQQKLTADQVREIRALHAAGVHSKEIAARFGITKRHSDNIIYRWCWEHLEDV